MNGLLAAEQAATERLNELQARLSVEAPDVATSVEGSLFTGSQKYTWVPPAIWRMNRALQERHPGSLADFNRYVLLDALVRFSLEDARYRLPASVTVLYAREFKRIFRQIDRFEDAFFDLSEDRYLKDLAILTHRLIPVGAEFAEGGAGIPRRLVLGGGPFKSLARLWFVLFRCGGFRPFFALHAHTLALEDFNEEGWLATYHRLAELLAQNPQVKGWLSASWFLDPALETISPHLAYLRRLPLDNGAALFFAGYDSEGTSGALTKSKTRQRLFAEGKYSPATYMRIWPRDAMIDWSKRQEGGA